MNNNDSAYQLLYNWNNYFRIDNTYSVGSYVDIDKLFNDYLLSISKSIEFELNTEICLCEQIDSVVRVYYVSNNEVVYKDFSLRSKKKFFSFIGDYETIITKKFPLSSDFFANSRILRYELIRNIFTSNHTHFFSKELPFSIDDMKVFFTIDFYKLILSDEQRLSNLLFGSYILNTFELGVTINDVILKPNITISPYGRWYWSGTAKIQNDLKSRNAIYNRFLDYGKIVTVDLVSGEPTILSELSGSVLLNKLVKYRIKLNKNGNIELSNLIKEILNIFIHSVDTPIVAYNKFKNKHNDYDVIENKLGISILDIFSSLQDEFMCYNNKVISSYKKELSIIENKRRIVNPSSILYSNVDIIKEHRKYLQGLTHDKIIRFAKLVHDEIDLLPIFTIHDSVCYFTTKDNENEVINVVKKIGKQIKTPITIEIMQKEKDD